MSKKNFKKDFDFRVKADPAAARVLENAGRYVAINPTADEHELLEKLGLEASDCKKVDLYWEFGEDIYFVQFQNSDYVSLRTPGVYIRKAPSGYTNIVVVTSEPAICANAISRRLTDLASRGIDQRSPGARLEKFDSGC